MRKRLISLILMLTFFPVFAVAQQQDTIVDVNAGIINAIADVSEYLDSNDEFVSRQDFILAAAKIFCIDTEQTSGPISFTDVDRTSELYRVLTYAVSAGYIADGEKFYPEEAIKANDAIKICVVAAGYKAAADLNGGYPGGYLKAASLAGITKSVASGVGSITAKDAYQLLYDTLDAPIMEQKINAQQDEFYVNNDVKLMNALHDIYYMKGIMNKNAYTAIGDSTCVGVSSKVEVDGESFDYTGDWNGYLGYNVTAYYKEDTDGERTLFYAYPTKNNTLTIDAKDASFDGEKISYFNDDEKKKDAKIDPAFSFIYNGKFAEATDIAQIIPEYGSIELIDNDNDGKYEIVKVRQQQYITDYTIDTVNMSFIDNETGLYINLDDNERVITIKNFNDGSERDIYSLTGSEVLGAVISKDQKYIEFYVFKDSVNGQIDYIDSDQKIISISGQEYKISDYFINNYPNISLVITGTFYLGFDSEIVTAKLESTQMQYGYIVKYLQDPVAEFYALIIFTSEGKRITYQCGEKIKCNGETVYSRDLCSVIGDGSTIPQQLIKFAIKDEMLWKIDTAADGKEFYDEDRVDKDDSLTKYNFASVYNYRQGVFYPSFNVQSAIIFQVPAQGVTDEKAFSIKTSSVFGDGNYLSSVVIPYDVPESGCAKAIVYVNESTTIPATDKSEILVVDKCSLEWDDNESEVVRRLYGWQNGNFVEYIIDSDVEIDKVQGKNELVRGDIIRFASDNGIIKNLTVEFNAETMDDNNKSYFNTSSEPVHYQLGKAYSVSDGYVYIGIDTGNGYAFDMNSLINVKLPSQILVIDMETGDFRNCDQSMIRTYKNSGSKASTMIIKQHYRASNFAVVYNGVTK